MWELITRLLGLISSGLWHHVREGYQFLLYTLGFLSDGCYIETWWIADWSSDYTPKYVLHLQVRNICRIIAKFIEISKQKMLRMKNYVVLNIYLCMNCFPLDSQERHLRLLLLNREKIVFKKKIEVTKSWIWTEKWG